MSAAPLRTSGDIRRCPRCHGELVFVKHFVVRDAEAVVGRSGSLRPQRIRAEPAWTCVNRSCGYRELASDL